MREQGGFGKAPPETRDCFGRGLVIPQWQFCFPIGILILSCFLTQQVRIHAANGGYSTASKKAMTMTLEASRPTCWIVAGPNGAGKTTFALHYLPQVANCSRFINADLIAAGLSPLAPERELMAASRIFLREIEDAIGEGEDFAFETTLSGRGYLSLVKRLLNTGWRVELVYLALPSMEMSRLRVAERVSHGGHHIPLKDIQRRFPRSLHNLLTLYAPSVTRARCFMNAGGNPALIFEQSGTTRYIINEGDYTALIQEAQP